MCGFKKKKKKKKGKGEENEVGEGLLVLVCGGC
jgi:hypothetical protein